ncbi:MAG: hypothetical protein AB7O96_15915 [Pseudobdellovibrionaceae bacterium]
MRFLTLLILTFPFSAQASILTASRLNLGDSVRMSEALSPLGHTIEKDMSDPNLILRKTSFTSADRAFSIECTQKQKGGVELETTCLVSANSEKSAQGVTTVAAGAVANVTIVKFLNEHDMNAIARSLTRIMGFFQTSEQVLVTLASGKKIKVPKVRIECLPNSATICQATMFP